YGSTPAYHGVLELHGCGDLQAELNALSKRGDWKAMGDLVTDEVLEAFAVVAETPETVAAQLDARFRGAVTRLSCYAPYKSDPDRWAAVLTQLKALSPVRAATQPRSFPTPPSRSRL